MTILVLGYGLRIEGSLVCLNERTEKCCLEAIRLYHSGEIAKVAITISGRYHDSCDYSITLPKKMKERLIQGGVPEGSIIFSPAGLNTAGQIDVLLPQIGRRNLERIIFVGIWYQMPRIWWLASRRLKLNQIACVGVWRMPKSAELAREVGKAFIALFRPFKSSRVDSSSFDLKVTLSTDR